MARSTKYRRGYGGFPRSAQPHRHKVFVAGNHDVLLDEEFLQRNPERRYEEARTRDDLDWGSVIYLEDTSFTLDFSQDPNDTETAESRNHTSFRKLTVYGSPFTPQYGTSAFQYKPDPDFWTEKFGSLSIVPDILVTHGPPKLHLDTRGFYRAGCPYLSVEVARMRPRLHVFGHIHASQGREDVVLDGMQRAYEDVVIGWGDWGTVGWMVARVLWARLAWLSRGLRARVGENETTTFINASVVGGSDNRLVNEAVVFHC